jgi:hypothetical protein
MPGLVPGIHVLCAAKRCVDGREKPGHDAVEPFDAPSNVGTAVNLLITFPFILS